MPSNDNDPDISRRVRLWEQHGQTLMLTIITAALAYSGNALVKSEAAQAATTVELRNMSANVHRLEGAVTAMQQYVTRAEFAVQEQRLQTLENKR
jgi:hypothetical protein